MSDLERKREAVKKAYDSDRWHARVDGMPDGQIVAVYNRLRAQGKFGKI